MLTVMFLLVVSAFGLGFAWHDQSAKGNRQPQPGKNTEEIMTTTIQRESLDQQLK
jgi:hypothetical protein